MHDDNSEFKQLSELIAKRNELQTEINSILARMTMKQEERVSKLAESLSDSSKRK
ncbi:hypothetical protein M5X00_16775 [Paenibacillus alvei]|uniref:Uncharacterized protein n=1 Tax=Paenibacillus alvei TaxID=44250 RepID=A0AAP7A3G1_PAEAL|nr:MULTISPECIES: hypothetical protein [Paenibacillus]EJW17615.1 hypothetical protein PAV_3c00600 [Paenibacillus alvei DSM 29]MCY7486838.1 hypothetical protein [Paenibacillus alvei]MCY9540588.1 hypothetical protein [Paenibacillus alvei]MCY9582777.1 hypothetical protein [Paenibacillus alvei]MCY9587776.1 hypothetical protein [Paenibacillus alvei]